MKLPESLTRFLFRRPQQEASPPASEAAEWIRPVPYYVQLGHLNELAVLKAIAQFGWLTTKLVAAIAWPRHKYPQRAAQRTIARLCRQHALLKRELMGNTNVYVLTQAGVRRLADEGIEADAGTDLRLQWWRHRYFANAFLAHQLGQENVSGAVTEYQILRQDMAPEIQSLLAGKGKIPDGIVLKSVPVDVRKNDLEPSRYEQRIVRIWVELEFSRRRPSDARRLGKLIADWDCRSGHRIALVYPFQDPPGSHYTRIAKALRATLRAVLQASGRPDSALLAYTCSCVDVYLMHFSSGLQLTDARRIGTLEEVHNHGFRVRKLYEKSGSHGRQVDNAVGPRPDGRDPTKDD